MQPQHFTGTERSKYKSFTFADGIPAAVSGLLSPGHEGGEEIRQLLSFHIIWRPHYPGALECFKMHSSEFIYFSRSVFRDESTHCMSVFA